MRSARLAMVLDVACVLVFVIIGRASHGEGLTGVASTAWPFLAGLAGGWLATAGLAGRAWRPFGLWPAGVGAWLGAVVLGMLFRVVSGQGTAPAFIGVALAFLGLFLLGWRLLGRRLPGRLGVGHVIQPQSGSAAIRVQPRRSRPPR